MTHASQPVSLQRVAPRRGVHVWPELLALAAAACLHASGVLGLEAIIAAAAALAWLSWPRG